MAQALRLPTFLASLACGGGGLLTVLHCSHQRPRPHQTDDNPLASSSPALDLETASQSQSAPAPPWVILGTVARVSPEICPDDTSLGLATPPRVSILTIPPRVFPEKTTPDNFPSVLAADPSGLLLLHADQGRARDPSAAHRPGRRECQPWRDFIPGYFLLDAVAASALRIPNPERILHPGHLGLLASPQGGHGHYMLAELQPMYGSRAATATLLCLSSEVRKWVAKEVAYPLPPRRLLSPNGIVSHSGMLWWVDLSWCLLACDPCADKPLLRAVPLPPGKALEPREAWGVLDKYRCVGVSAGKLRFVDMYRNHDARGGPKISVWTLLDPDSMEWKLECEATFQDICDDESFKATGLPKKLPVLALVDPTNPDIVYFFLDKQLVGVDVRSRKVVACAACELVAPPSEFLSSRFVHAWQLPRPRALSSGFVPNDTTGSGSEWMESAFPTSSLTYVCEEQGTGRSPIKPDQVRRRCIGFV